MNFVWLRIFLVGWLAVTPVPVCADGAPKSAGVTVFGSDPDLSAGAAALQLGNFEEGIRLTLEGLKRGPAARNRASGFNNLCAGYVGARQYEQAMEACDAALEINASNWHVYNNRALALLGLGRLEEARRDHETGLALKPDSPKLGKVRGLIDARHAETVLAVGNEPEAPADAGAE